MTNRIHRNGYSDNWPLFKEYWESMSIKIPEEILAFDSFGEFKTNINRLHRNCVLRKKRREQSHARLGEKAEQLKKEIYTLC